MTDWPIKITQLLKMNYHRNGVDGVPFTVVLFKDSGSEKGTKVGIVFCTPFHVAVFDFAKLAAGDIGDVSNQYRGDVFEALLREAIGEDSVKQIGEIGGAAGQAQHTPEPWRYVDDSTPADRELGLGQYCIETADGALDVASQLNSEADARRICAAVNACQSISTEVLEHGAVKQLLQAIDGLLAFIGHGHDDKPAVYIARAVRARVVGETQPTTQA